MNFEHQLAAMLAQERARQVRTFAAAVLQLQRLVVSGTNGLPGTPEDTNLARSNWFVEADAPSGNTTKDTTTRNLGLASSVVVAALARGEAVQEFYLFNNLPYIRHLEYGLYPNPPKNPTGKTVNGHSTQAPQGFFRVALARWDGLLKEAAK